MLGKSKVTDEEPCEHMIQMYDGSYTVSVFSTCLKLVNFTEHIKSNVLYYSNYLVLVFAFTNAIIPFLMLTRSSGSGHALIPNDGWVIAFYVSSTLLNVMYGSIIFNFMLITIYDATRQQKLFASLREMVRISDFYVNKRSKVGPLDPQMQHLKQKEKVLRYRADIRENFAALQRSPSNRMHYSQGRPRPGSVGPSSPAKLLYTNQQAISVSQKGEHQPQTQGTQYSLAAPPSPTERQGGEVDSARAPQLSMKLGIPSSELSSSTGPGYSSKNSAGRATQSLTVGYTSGASESTPGIQRKASVELRLDDFPVDDDSLYGSSLKYFEGKASRMTDVDGSGKSLEDDLERVLGRVQVKEDEYINLPRLNMKHDSNVVAWTYARLMLQYFGDRFRFRLDIFVGKLNTPHSTLTYDLYFL